jgi:hypothetical protein
MKVCPKCSQQYDDENLNFCLSDGELLMETDSADATPTVYMDAPRVTNQDWNPQTASPPVQQQQNQQMFQQPYSGVQQFPRVVSQDKTLATVSLVLGILSLLLMCCYLGLPLGAGALITGYLGMNRSNLDPESYGGKELAIIGMVLGGISTALSLGMIVLWLIAVIFG